MEKDKREERRDKEGGREYDQARHLKALDSLEERQLLSDIGCRGPGTHQSPGTTSKETVSLGSTFSNPGMVRCYFYTRS